MQFIIRVKQPGRKHALIDNKIVIVEDIDDAKLAEVVSKFYYWPRKKTFRSYSFNSIKL